MRWLLIAMTASACGDNGAQLDAALDSPVDVMIDADLNMPATLADTGLCVDPACSQINAGILAYRPRFELWTDGAVKRRWISLPPGTQIDTSDMDHWRFPVGTKLWKEFTRDNVRVETRLVMRVGAGDSSADWFYASYVWNQAQNATTAEPMGVTDANGTQHDVPNQAQCRSCHENLKPSRALGFGAIQLDFENPILGELDLGELVAMNLLTSPPAISAPPFFFPLPPDNTGYALPALGYLHANCGHCHNPSSTVFVIDTPVVLRLTVGALGTLAETPTYTTGVNVAGDPIGGRRRIVVPSMPDASILIYRFESMTPNERMPAIGTEVMDPTGSALLRDWITNL